MIGRAAQHHQIHHPGSEGDFQAIAAGRARSGRRARSGPSHAISVPPNCTVPLSARLRPASTSSRVDLPAPFGPMIAVQAPAGTSSEISAEPADAPADVCWRGSRARLEAAAAPSSSARKNGAPSRLVTMPIGSSAGATISRQSVSASRIRMPPEQSRADQEHAMRRADGEPDHMRRHDADEDDDAGEGDGGADAGGDGHDQQALRGLDIEAQGLRLALAQHHPVEHPRQGRGRRARRPARPARPAESGPQPLPPKTPASRN